MRYTENLTFSSKDWAKVREEAEHYEITLPKSLNSIQVGQREHWEGTHKNNTYTWRGNTTKLDIIKIEELFVNTRNTVKVAVASEHLVALIPRNTGASGWLAIETTRSKGNDLFENIQKGSWAICFEPWRSRDNRVEVVWLTNEPTKEKVIEMIEALFGIFKKQDIHPEFRWEVGQTTIETSGIVSHLEVMGLKAIFEKALRKYRWNKRRKLWQKANAVAKRLKTFVRTKTSFQVEVLALDGALYKADVQLDPNQDLRYTSGVTDRDVWEELCWIDPEHDASFYSSSPGKKAQRFVNTMLSLVSALSSSSMVISRNKRKIKIDRKKTTSGNSLTYLDNKIVAGEEVRGKILDFFMTGKAISASSQQVVAGLQRAVLVKRKTEKERYIEEGLNGEMRDLEGDFPFHLNVIYKEKKRRWFIEISGKEYHVPGGIASLRKIKSAIEGKAIINHSEYGYDQRSTRVVRKRLEGLIGKDEALKVVIQVKQMGALLNAMNGAS